MSVADAPQSSRRKLRFLSSPYLLPAGVLLIVCFLKQLWLTNELPLNWDEAFNLQVVLVLLKKGIYGISSDNFSQVSSFNPQITTGPTLLLPVAAICSLLGYSVQNARLTILLFCILFCLLIYRFFRKANCSQLAACSAALMLFSVPFYRDFGSVILGEVPAAVFLLISVRCLLRWSDATAKPGNSLLSSSTGWLLVSGFFSGLAVLTKNQYLIFLPAIPLEICLAFYCARVHNLGELWKTVCDLKHLFMSCLRSILPLLFFCFSLVLAPGLFLLIVYTQKGAAGLQEFSSFFQGFAGNTQGKSWQVALTHASQIWDWLWLPLISWLAAALLMPRQFFPTLDGKPFRVLNVMILGWFSWWIFFNQSSWGRHLFPALLLAVPFFSGQAIHALEQFCHYGAWRKHRLRSAAAAFVLALPLISGVSDYLKFDLRKVDYNQAFPGEEIAGKKVGTYAEWARAERRAANFVHRLAPNTLVCTSNWFRDFRIEVRLGQNFCAFENQDLKNLRQPMALIYHRFEQAYFAPDHVKRRREWHRGFANRAQNIEGYRFYFIPAAPIPLEAVPLKLDSLQPMPE